MDFYIGDEELKKYFSNISFIFNNIKLIREHLDIIFVFGSVDKKSSGRSLFMDFIENKQNTPFNFVTIESLYSDLREYAFKEKGAKLEKIKLAELEYMAIKNAFSVLIFPESPGSFAELGYFSAREDTRKKIIVSNQLKYYNKQTYVNSVIDFIHEDKEIKPIIYTDTENELHFENYINNLLKSYTDYHNEIYKELKKTDEHMFPIAVLYELIKLFPFLIFSELLSLIKYAFEELSIKIEKIEDYLISMISLLVISNLIERKEFEGKKFFCVIDDNFSCFKFKNTEAEHLKILLHVKEINERKSL